ncbi:MAG: RidA family protein [Rhodospirillum sp.]|nr:RidA family protein [Rhodospirillum sp.]MCF8490284.1 RidA family protein [Rhodospirillum sp.]MCF8499345.1 RidA family protein [Rhodospirillum sp.]
MDRRTISSGYSSEETYGYSRAVRIGPFIFVSGTTARASDLEKDSHGQAKAALAIVAEALAEAGASLEDVARTVAYVVDMADEPQIARAHAETFGPIRPASTIVQVSGLSPKEARVEFEITAVVSANRAT